jgi:hypothetical protein
MPITHKMEISFWQESDGIHINFDTDGISTITGITTVNDKNSSMRGHPHLYDQLKQILIKEGKWQQNEEVY